MSTLVSFHLPFPFRLSSKRMSQMQTIPVHTCVLPFFPFPFNLSFLFLFNFHQNTSLWHMSQMQAILVHTCAAFVFLLSCSLNSNEACVNACVTCVTACAITYAFDKHKNARVWTSLASSLALWHASLTNVKPFNS